MCVVQGRAHVRWTQVIRLKMVLRHSVTPDFHATALSPPLDVQVEFRRILVIGPVDSEHNPSHYSVRARCRTYHRQFDHTHGAFLHPGRESVDTREYAAICSWNIQPCVKAVIAARNPRHLVIVQPIHNRRCSRFLHDVFRKVRSHEHRTARWPR